MYDNLSRIIEEVTHKTTPFQLDGEFVVFSNTKQRNHTSIVNVIEISWFLMGRDFVEIKHKCFQIK